MKAVFVSAEACELRDIPIPEPGDHEVLIRNVAVASNPKDWKTPAMVPGYNYVEGNDVAGHIHKIGKNITRFSIGDKVAGFSKMASGDEYGAYQEYTVVTEGCVFRLGERTSFEEAATLPLAYMTAAIGLFVRLGLPTPDEAVLEGEKKAVLIYGGGTTVGVFAIQLAKLANLYVVTVAGGSLEVAKSYGADEIIDYRNKSSSQLTSLIAQAANGRIHHCLDAVAENGTPFLIGAALDLTGPGGRYTNVLSIRRADRSKMPPSVVQNGWTAVAEAYGEQREFAEKWYTRLGEWLEEGRFRGHRVKIVPRGLEGVQEGLRRLQTGEVRGEKLVYRIAETPGVERKAKL